MVRAVALSLRALGAIYTADALRLDLPMVTFDKTHEQGCSH